MLARAASAPGRSPQAASGPSPGGARAAGRRRALVLALGALWLLDGVLQLQPSMFAAGSYGLLGSLVANAMPTGTLYTGLEQAALTTFHAHLVPMDLAAAAVQLLVGAALVVGSWKQRGALERIGLAGSIGWGLCIWVIGEAFGNLIFPQDSMVVGAPGAALVYAVLAVALWPAGDGPPERGALLPAGAAAGAPASASALGLRFGVAAWTVLWDATALLFLEIGNRAPDGLAAQISNEAAGEPSWLAGMDRAIGRGLLGHGVVVAFVLAVVQVSIGQGALRPRSRRLALGAGIALSTAYWVVGQNFGDLLTGHASDPNVGPPMILLACALWPLGAGRRRAPAASLAAGERGVAPPGQAAAPAEPAVP